MKLLNLSLILFLSCTCASFIAGKTSSQLEQIKQDDSIEDSHAKQSLEEDSETTPSRFHPATAKKISLAYATINGLGFLACICALGTTGAHFVQAASNLLINHAEPAGNNDDAIIAQMRKEGREEDPSKAGLAYFPIIISALSYCSFKLAVQVKEAIKQARKHGAEAAVLKKETAAAA